VNVTLIGFIPARRNIFDARVDNAYEPQDSLLEWANRTIAKQWVGNATSTCSRNSNGSLRQTGEILKKLTFMFWFSDLVSQSILLADSLAA